MTLSRTTIYMGLAALVSFVLAIVVGFQDPFTVPPSERAEEALFPDLEPKLSESDRIVIDGPENQVEMARIDSGWVVNTKDGYPADQGRINTLFGGLIRAEREKPRTANPDLFDRMGLGDAAGSFALFSKEEELAAFLFGNQITTPEGEILSYVLMPGEERVWTATGLTPLYTDPLYWLPRNILSVSRARIKRVEISFGDGHRFALSRPAPGRDNFMQEEGQTGVFDREALSNLVYAISNVTFDDVAREDQLELFHVADARYETFDGLKIQIRFYDHEGIIWAGFRANYDEGVLEDPNTPSVLPDAPLDGQAEADDLNAKWQGWVYQLPIEKASQILKRKSELGTQIVQNDLGSP